MPVPISETEYRRNVEPAFTSVFRSVDPFDEPFQDRITHRLLLWPVGFALDDGEIAALADTVKAAGDTSFYVSILERPPKEESPEDADKRVWHWRIPVKEADGYRAITLPFENALYSPTGKWGVMISHEQHAVVGGNEQFVQSLLAHRAIVAKSNPDEFLQYWHQAQVNWGAETDWIPGLLAHIYGRADATRLLSGHYFGR